MARREPKTDEIRQWWHDEQADLRNTLDQILSWNDEKLNLTVVTCLAAMFRLVQDAKALPREPRLEQEKVYALLEDANMAHLAILALRGKKRA